MAHVKTIYATIVLSAVALVGVAFFQNALELKDVGIGLLASLGTLLGATLAFRLNEDREAKKEETAQRVGLNRALFILARQRNAVTLIMRELEKYKSPIDRAFNFPATKVAPYNDLIHRFEDLEFLLDTSDVNIVLRLTVEQERFHQMLEALKVRNDFYVHELLPEIEKRQLNGKQASVAAVANEFGERLFGSAMSYSESVSRHVESSMKSIPEMHEELRKIAKRRYPEGRFVDYIPQ